jgi:hypothetical protein
MTQLDGPTDERDDSVPQGPPDRKSTKDGQWSRFRSRKTPPGGLQQHIPTDIHAGDATSSIYDPSLLSHVSPYRKTPYPRSLLPRSLRHYHLFHNNDTDSDISIGPAKEAGGVHLHSRITNLLRSNDRRNVQESGGLPVESELPKDVRKRWKKACKEEKKRRRQQEKEEKREEKTQER